MTKRQVSAPNTEPDQKEFKHPTQKEHLFQVVDFVKNDDPNIELVKLEVVGGDEQGRSLLHRVSLDSTWNGFFTTRLFLKAIGLTYKGDFEIDSDEWIGRQFYATVVHNEDKKTKKVYANIKEYNFDKMIENNIHITKSEPVSKKDIAWDE